MDDQIGDALRHHFAAEAADSPSAEPLQRGVRRRIARRRLVQTTAIAGCLAVIGGVVVAIEHRSSPPRAKIAAAAASKSPDARVSPRHGALPAQRGASCAVQYSASALNARVFAFDGTVRSIQAEPSATAAPDRPRLPLDRVTFRVDRWFRGGSGSTTTILMSPPARVAQDSAAETFESYQAGTRLLVSGDRQSATDGGLLVAWSCGFTRYYDDGTAASWASAFGS